MGFNIDEIIQRLLRVSTVHKDFTHVLKKSEIKILCSKSAEIFLKQPMLLELGSPIKVVGDIHGQYSDLLRLFKSSGNPSDVNYLFLGDYVDRGKQSLETICLLLAYKIKYPHNFFMLRGNHECGMDLIKEDSGESFVRECKRRANLKIWRLFVECFNCLPVAAVIDKRIFCCHAGLSPELDDINQINRLRRPTPIPTAGLMCDLLWADPDEKIMAWGVSDRNVSHTFGDQVLSEFLKRNDLDMICRGHESLLDGYGYKFNKRLVTVFSAPNYCGTMGNNGALFCVWEDLKCTFEFLLPQ